MSGTGLGLPHSEGSTAACCSLHCCSTQARWQGVCPLHSWLRPRCLHLYGIPVLVLQHASSSGKAWRQICSQLACVIILSCETDVEIPRRSPCFPQSCACMCMRQGVPFLGMPHQFIPVCTLPSPSLFCACTSSSKIVWLSTG